MIEGAQATSSECTFDVICVHTFSRFYRNGAEMEMTIRRLKKAGVEVVSVTQPTGDDPSQSLMRQIIGIFDEYISRENGKNVTRAMRESAKQGFWNGATPPLGHRIVEAERRGSKIKKRLGVDSVGSELVRLIFALYAEGHEGSGPLGVKEVTKLLNAKGYRTRRGSTFGLGPVFGIVTKACYATGKWPYGCRNSRTRGLNNPADIVEIDVPVIVPLVLFEQVQARLSAHYPKVTPPRVANGPSLLVGLATCASCRAGMTRTGTAKRGKAYSYHNFGGCHAKGRAVCKGRHVPTVKLHLAVTQAVRDKLLTPECIAAFVDLVRQKIETADIEARKAYFQVVAPEIRVDDHKIQIIGDKASLAAVIAGKQTAGGKVSGFVRKWRARQDSNP